MKKVILQIGLALVIFALAYFVYESIMGPVRFNKEKKYRSEIVVQRMKDIRSLQTTYKSINGRYAPTFDTLIDFAKNGQIPIVNIIADPEDTTFTKTISDTTGYEKVFVSLFADRTDFNIDDLSYVPFSGREKIKMHAGVIERANIEVNVFEAIASKKAFLKGLDPIYINRDNIKDVVLGSMTEPSTDGNWE